MTIIDTTRDHSTPEWPTAANNDTSGTDYTAVQRDHGTHGHIRDDAKIAFYAGVVVPTAREYHASLPALPQVMPCHGQLSHNEFRDAAQEQVRPRMWVTMCSVAVTKSQFRLGLCLLFPKMRYMHP